MNISLEYCVAATVLTPCSNYLMTQQNEHNVHNWDFWVYIFYNYIAHIYLNRRCDLKPKHG